MAAEGNVLAGLQEIPLPAPVPYVPQTLGWLVVAVVLALLVAYVALRIVRHHRENAYRREALAELAALERALLRSARSEADERSITWSALPELLKRTAIAATSRDRVASLSGQEWLRFLDSTLGGDSFARGTGQLLTRIAYAPTDLAGRVPRKDLQELFRLSRRWIAHHHVHV